MQFYSGGTSHVGPLALRFLTHTFPHQISIFMYCLASDTAYRVPWTEEPSVLQSIGSQRVGQD